MKLRLKLLLGIVLIIVGVLWLGTRVANATKTHNKVWKQLYLDPESNDPKDAALIQAYEKASCNTCHAGSKKKLNTYGELVKKLHSRVKTKAKRDRIKMKEEEMVRMELQEAAKINSNQNDPKSPTYGALIGQGKLPVENFSKDKEVKQAAADAIAAKEAVWHTWTSADGKFKIEAQFITFQDGRVHLKTRDGRAIQVTPSVLSQIDRDRYRDFLKARKQKGSDKKDEWKAATTTPP